MVFYREISAIMLFGVVTLSSFAETPDWMIDGEELVFNRDTNGLMFYAFMSSEPCPVVEFWDPARLIDLVKKDKDHIVQLSKAANRYTLPKTNGTLYLFVSPDTFEGLNDFRMDVPRPRILLRKGAEPNERRSRRPSVVDEERVPLKLLKLEKKDDSISIYIVGEP